MPQLSRNLKVSGSERRRFRRIPILQRALLKIADGTPFPGEISDFCQGGLFLRLTGNPSVLKAGTQSIGCPIEISFVANHRPGHPKFGLSGTIVRVRESGLGVAFNAPETSEALEALHEIARATETSTQPLAPEFERTCREAFHRVLPEIMRHFSEHIRDNLLDAADHAETAAAQTAYFDAVTIFDDAPEIVEHFRAHALSQTEGHAVAASAEPERRDPKSLSLLEKDAFEDWLNLTGEAAKLDSLFEEPLRMLERRLGWVAETPGGAKYNPYGPVGLCRAFRQAIETLPLATPARSVAYKTLRLALRDTLGPFYRQLLELTAALEFNDLPKITRDSRRPGNPRSAIATVPEENTHHAPSAPTAGGERTMGGAPDLCATFAALTHLNLAGTAGKAAVQAKPADWAGAMAFASEIFHNRLSEPQVNALQMLGAVLTGIRAEPSMPEGLQPILKQWQLPLLKLAIQDPRLLNDPEHPARRLLDMLDRVALAADSHGRIEENLARRLNEWTERLARDGARDPTVLEQVTESLEKLTEPLLRARNLRIRRLREIRESQQRIERARREVNAEIELRLAGAAIPDIVPELLETGWREWMVVAYLRGDMAHEWLESLKVLDSLLIWLEPSNRLPDAVTAYQFIESVEDRLWPYALDIAACRHLIDELAELLIHGKKPHRVQWSGEPAQASVDSEPKPLKQPCSARLRSFRIGDWCQIALEPGAAPVPLNIAWIDENRGRFVFVDRQGTKRLELDAESFSRSLEERRAIRAEGLDLPLSERIVGKLLQDAQESVRNQAHIDPATGLFNQKGFTGRLSQEFTDNDKLAASYALCILELDQFRGISTLCGPEDGERLLREIADIFKQYLAPHEIMARIGDSRFGVLYPGCDLEISRMKTEGMVNGLAGYRFQWENRSFAVGGHAGLAVFKIDAETPASVLKHADTACMRAKELGVNQIQIYAADDPTLSRREQSLDWAGRIDSILAENRLFVRCQKIAPLNDIHGAASHYEILLGIRGEDGSLLSPADFVAAAERWNRISDIDRSQVESVFAWIRREPGRFAALGGFSINLSGQSVNSEEFMDFLHRRLAEADWPLEKITFEITETAAIEEFSQAERFIRRIRRHGCRFSLDDFGSGFASYAYLKNLEVDYLKIDGAFVRDLAHSETDYAMVKSMNEVGHSLGIKTIAEYVESEEILAKLREIGVDYAQGYHIGKPRLLMDI